MAKSTIIYWRDIPSQVVVKQGRNSTKAQLSKRFMEAIDKAADPVLRNVIKNLLGKKFPIL